MSSRRKKDIENDDSSELSEEYDDFDEKENQNKIDKRKLYKKQQIELLAMIRELGLSPDDIDMI